MPTQTEINNLHQSLIDKAAIIQAKAELVATKTALRQAAKDAKELRRAQLHTPIAADRITYQNEPQRDSALIEATADDASYQTHLQDEYTATTDKTVSESEAELNRKLYRADELLLLYYANNPATP